MRILIADDHSIFRNGLKQLLQDLDDNAEFIEANSFAKAVEISKQTPLPDLFLLDLFAPNAIDGTSLAEFCDAVAPRPVVIFSMSEDLGDMRRVMRAGARGFVPKSTDDGLFVSILQMVLAGGIYTPPVLDGVADGEGADGAVISRPAPQGRLAALTPRQQDVLQMMAEGLSNKDIGDRLNLNINTVKGHVTAILRTLGVDNRTQAVLLARETD